MRRADALREDGGEEVFVGGWQGGITKPRFPLLRNRGLSHHSLTSLESLPFMDHGGEKTVIEINVQVKEIRYCDTFLECGWI